MREFNDRPPNVETALHYASRGWAVLPMRGKKFYTSDGVRMATRDPNIIKQWGWAESFGMACGEPSRTDVLDVDNADAFAMTVARILVVYLRRSGGQSQYSALLAAQAEAESDTFGELERWIAEHLTSDLRVEALAERVHMSPRNFARAYAAKRRRTPAKTVEAIRLDAARRSLEETDERIESVAKLCGFSSEEQMRCAFLRNIKIPPREYRRRFASLAMPE